MVHRPIAKLPISQTTSVYRAGETAPTRASALQIGDLQHQLLMAMHNGVNRVKVFGSLKAPRESPFPKETAEAAYHDDG
jgi:hypothetical protein